MLLRSSRSCRSPRCSCATPTPGPAGPAAAVPRRSSSRRCRSVRSILHKEEEKEIAGPYQCP